MGAGGFASQLDCAAHLMHEMWNVDRRQRIGTFYDEQIAGAQAPQCLAGTQDGQRAFQPFEIETRRRGNRHARLIYRTGRAMNSQHANLVTGQFGPRAAAYVASEVHARGADLDQAVALLGGHPEARVLDLGCGGGHLSFHVAPLVREVVAYDLSPDMLVAVAGVASERGLVNVATRLGAAEDLPFPKSSFDFVVSRYSAHHWHGFHEALTEACRVLRPGGIALFMDAVSPGVGLLDTYLQSIELLRDPSHVRDYAVAEWTHALAAAGFVPHGVTMRRLRIEFAAWVERMATPRLHIEAIRALQARMAEDVVKYFEIEADGSFTFDTATIEASR